MVETQYTPLYNSESDPTLEYISQMLLEEDINENFNRSEAANLHHIEKPFYDILEQKYPPFPEKHPIAIRLEAGSTKESGIECPSTLEIEFQRGVEQGLKFLPTIDKLKNDINSVNLELDENESRGNKGKKNTNMDLSEGQNRKLPMIYYEESIRDDTFDQVLLYHGESYEIEEISNLHEKMQIKANPNKKNHVDLRRLLVSCADAIAINDNKIAFSLINEIRKHSSPNGDETQRLSYYFVNALDARLAGTGSEYYRHLISKRNAITDTLKSYHLYIKASPFYRVSYCLANQAILRATKGSSKIHIIDLGIAFGFQWPSLIQSLANNRKGEIIKLRVTGIDFPQMGFRPAERVEEIGRRLENYAKSFNVPFEYKGIASKWEEIRIEDLKMEKGEFLVVNTLFHLRRVQDEAFRLDSPRNQVLNLIWKIKPDIFIHGVFNLTFSPFFITRFRQALLHYSSWFDMFATKVPQENKYRKFVERECLGRDIVNSIACEGSDWTHRPETYKQWHVRNLRHGFEPVLVEQDIVKVCEEKVKNFYDSRFFIEQDGNWLLQGWKGRINYALSLWKPNLE